MSEKQTFEAATQVEAFGWRMNGGQNKKDCV
jgi:hypothetical protein